MLTTHNGRRIYHAVGVEGCNAYCRVNQHAIIVLVDGASQVPLEDQVAMIAAEIPYRILHWEPVREPVRLPGYLTAHDCEGGTGYADLNNSIQIMLIIREDL